MSCNCRKKQEKNNPKSIPNNPVREEKRIPQPVLPIEKRVKRP